MAYTNPSKGLYLNLQRMRAMEKVKEKPISKGNGLLSSTAKRMKNQDTMDSSLRRVASYVELLQQKRQELKNG